MDKYVFTGIFCRYCREGDVEHEIVLEEWCTLGRVSDGPAGEDSYCYGDRAWCPHCGLEYNARFIQYEMSDEASEKAGL